MDAKRACIGVGVLLAAACTQAQVRQSYVVPGGPAAEAAPSPPGDLPGTHLVRIEARDFATWLRVPEDVWFETEGDTVTIRAGGHFGLHVQRGGNLDIASRRAAVVMTVGQRLQGFEVDEPDALMYATTATPEGLGGGWHVYAQIPTAAGTLTCRSLDDLAFTRDEAEAMLDACRTLGRRP